MQAVSIAVHQSHALKGRAKSGRTVIIIPEMPSPAPNHRKNLIFTDNRTTKFHGSKRKDVETKQPNKVLHAAHTEVSIEAGQGQAVVPPPMPPPLRIRREGRTLTKGSSVALVGARLCSLGGVPWVPAETSGTVL